MSRQGVWYSGLFLAALAVFTPLAAQAQDAPPLRNWDPYVAVFGGISMPMKTDVQSNGTLTVGSTTFPNSSLKTNGVTLDNSAAWGGKLGLWNTQLRDATDLDFGIQLDVTNFYPSVAGGQNVSGSLSSGGAPVTLTGIQTQHVSMSSTIFAGNVMVRWPMALSPEYPNGEWFPYIGAGAGLQRTDYSSSAGSGTANDIVYQALAGLQYHLTPSLALFGEYKYTTSEQTLKLGGSNDTYKFNINHVVAGLALHF